MTRRAFAAVVALALSCIAACATAKNLWLVDEGRLERIDTASGVAQPILALAGVRDVAPTGTGGAWVLTADALVRLDESLAPQARAPLLSEELAVMGPIAADRADASLWAGVGTALVRFDAGASRVREIALDGAALAIATMGPDALFVATASSLLRIDASGTIVARANLARYAGGAPVSLLVDPLAGYVWLVRPGAIVQFDALAGLGMRAMIAAPVVDAADIDARTGILTLVAGQRVLRFDREAAPVPPDALASEPFIDLVGIEGAPHDPLLWFGDRIGFGIVGLADGAVVRLPGSRPVDRFVADPAHVELRLDADLTGVTWTDASTRLALRFTVLCDALDCTATPAYRRRLRLQAFGGGDDLSALFANGDESRTFAADLPWAPWQLAPPLRATVADIWGNRSDQAVVTWPIGSNARRQAMAGPTVAITAPTNNTTSTAPLNTTIKATATPGAGATITKVEFFAGTTLLGTATAAPYNLIWSYVQVGTYALTAKVTDSLGATASSTVVNVTVTAGTRAAAIDAWPFNDAWPTSGVAVDAAGTHNGTPTGTLSAATSAATVPKPDTCKAVSFGGGAIDIGGLAVSTAAAAKTTIAFWMYWNGAESVIPVGWVTHDLILSGGAFGFGTLNSDVFGVASTGLANKWHHVVAEFTNGAVTSNKLYLDAVPQTLSQRAGTPLSANAVVAASLRLGGLPGSTSYRFGGQLDEVRLFKRALTATEVSAEFAAANACGTAPAVSLSAPVNNSNFIAPATIALTAAASATATGAALTKLEFYNGTALLAADTTSPYTYTWSNVPIGNYALAVKATDSKGTTATSTAATVHVKANVAPTVTMTAPANNSSYTAPATINLAATATDSDGIVAKVEFYQGSTRLATVTTAPYIYAWTSVVGGSYVLTAKATDDRGAVTTSAAINVKVNKTPTVSITAPANDAVIVLPASITINATATDADGTISKVEFYRDGVLLGADTASPFSYVWASAGVGTHALTAKATDNLGAVSTSAPVTITVKVNQMPTVSIMAPTDGAQFVVGDVVNITATAADADGSIGKVEFLRDGALMGSDATSPYSYPWTTNVSGTFALTARASDNKGAAVTSTPVTVTVVENQPPTVTLATPTDGQLFVSPSSLPNITLAATAADPDGSIAMVRFYKQAQGIHGDPTPVLLGTLTAPPYQMTWSSVPYTDPPPYGVNVDYYDVWAEATDNRGAVASDIVSIRVLANPPPSSITAQITSPFSYLGTEPILFRAPATILLSARSAGGPSAISKMEFLANGSVVGTATVPNTDDGELKALWRNVASGTYALTARLTDNQGFISTSSPVTVSVGVPNPPVVTLTAPTGDQFVPVVLGSYAPYLPYSATLSDPGGATVRVEFDDSSRLLSWPASPPYGGTVSSPNGGLHVITARALDARYRELARSAPAYALVASGNRPIVAVMTSPTASATYGSGVTLTVDSIAPDEAIARVDFYSGNTPLGTVLAPPWSIGANFSPGVQSVYAVVTAQHSKTAITTPVTFTVSGAASGTSIKLTSPIEGQRFNDPATIPLAVSLTDPGGIITRVDYYWSININGGLIASSTHAPWSATWSGGGIGEYWLTAVGTYAGGTVTSAPVHVSVAAAAPVTLTAPTDGSMLAPGQAVAMMARVAVPGHALSRVEFVADGGVVGTVTVNGGPSVAMVNYSWAGAAAGVHTLTARCIATDGYTATSAPITVDVTDLGVTLAEPFPSQVYLSPADIRITAGPSATGGIVAQVDFYGDGAFLGSRTIAPYSFVWSGVTAGAHTVSAKVRDAAGFTASSSAISVTSLAMPMIAIDAGLDGSSVADDNASISGTIQAPMNSAVIVNGKGAALDRNGRFFVDNISLQPGTNTLTVALNTQDGNPITRTLTLGSTGTAPFQVTVDPQEGLAPLSATMTITNRGKVAFQRIEIDINDDGTPEQTLTSLVDNRVVLGLTFPNAGTYKMRVTVYGPSNNVIYVTRRTVRAYSPAELGLKVVAVYASMVDRLAANNPTGALRLFTGDSQQKYSDIFTALAGSLPDVAAQLGTFIDGVITEQTAEVTIVRDTADGKQSFMIYLIRGGDGLWRIESM